MGIVSRRNAFHLAMSAVVLKALRKYGKLSSKRALFVSSLLFVSQLNRAQLQFLFPLVSSSAISTSPIAKRMQRSNPLLALLLYAISCAYIIELWAYDHCNLSKTLRHFADKNSGLTSDQLMRLRQDMQDNGWVSRELTCDVGQELFLVYSACLKGLSKSFGKMIMIQAVVQLIMSRLRSGNLKISADFFRKQAMKWIKAVGFMFILYQGTLTAVFLSTKYSQLHQNKMNLYVYTLVAIMLASRIQSRSQQNQAIGFVLGQSLVAKLNQSDINIKWMIPAICLVISRSAMI